MKNQWGLLRNCFHAKGAPRLSYSCSFTHLNNTLNHRLGGNLRLPQLARPINDGHSEGVHVLFRRNGAKRAASDVFLDALHFSGLSTSNAKNDRRGLYAGSSFPFGGTQVA